MLSLIAGLSAFTAYAPPANSVLLKLKFPKGKIERMSATTDMSETMGVPGTTQKVAMDLVQSVTLLTHVVQSSASGAIVGMTYENMQSTSKMNGKPMPKQNPDPLAAIRGKSVQVIFDGRGNIQDIRGFEALMASSIKSLPPQMQQAFKGVFSKDSMRQMWNLQFGGIVPNRAVNVGESWTAAASMGGAPLEIKMKLRLRLLGVEQRGGKRLARISMGGSGNFDMSGIAPGLKMSATKMGISGTCYFDVDRGWLSSQTMSISMSGSMSMPAQGTQQSASFAMHGVSKTTVTSVR